MISLSQIETDLKSAMKAKDQVAVDTLRGLKTRVQNEQIAKTRELEEAEIISLIRSEVKRRKEAAEAFQKGERVELAQKETQEAEILQKYLPAQMSEEQLTGIIEKTITEMSATSADFGKVMGKLKAEVGDKADGAMLAKILKEKLK